MLSLKMTKLLFIRPVGENDVGNGAQDPEEQVVWGPFRHIIVSVRLSVN